MSPQFLLGSYNHTVDDKYRVAVPAGYRPALGNKFYLTPSLSDDEKHLRLYSEVEYEKLISRLEDWDPASGKGIAPNDVKGQRLLRRFYTHSAVVETDSQGRVTLNAKLRELAGIGKHVVFVGRRTCAELWDAGVFEEDQRAAEGHLADYLSK